MSHSYFTRKLLNIKDKNITFPEDYLEEVKLNGVTSFIFKGILFLIIIHTWSSCCGAVGKNLTAIAWVAAGTWV